MTWWQQRTKAGPLRTSTKHRPGG